MAEFEVGRTSLSSLLIAAKIVKGREIVYFFIVEMRLESSVELSKKLSRVTGKDSLGLVLKARSALLKGTLLYEFEDKLKAESQFQKDFLLN